MISFPILAALALVPFSVAQSNDPGLQIAAIEAHFSNAGLVPNLLTSFSPEASLTVNFNGVGDVAPGTALTQDRELFEKYRRPTMAESYISQRSKRLPICRSRQEILPLSSMGSSHWLWSMLVR